MVVLSQEKRAKLERECSELVVSRERSGKQVTSEAATTLLMGQEEAGSRKHLVESLAPALAYSKVDE